MHALLVVAKEKNLKEEYLATLTSKHKINSLDITRIAPHNSIGIEEVREIKRKIMLKPFQSETKAVVIDDAQLLTIEAQNALLKTLEEPPEDTIIILLTSTADVFLPTVLSRCQIVELDNRSQASPRDSARGELGKGDIPILESQLIILTVGGLGQRLKLAEDIGKNREGALAWLEKAILTMRRQLLIKLNDSNLPDYLKILISLQRTHTFLRTTNVNPRFTLETLFLSLSKNQKNIT